MPSPPAYVKNYDPGVTNIRNASSPHWRRWLGPASRCVLPFTSFAEPDPASKVRGERVPNALFAKDETKPLMLFAGFWTPWKGVRKVGDGEQEYGLFGFLTKSPNEIVSPFQSDACDTDDAGRSRYQAGGAVGRSASPSKAPAL